MTSYRLFLVRSALARFGRALAYYWLTLRTAVRTWWASYRFTLVRVRVRAAASALGRALFRLPRTTGALLGLIGWFLRQLPSYFGRVLAERREDRADLRAERRLAAAASRAQRAERREIRQAGAAERRSRRRAQRAEIKADSRKQLQSLAAMPGWVSRLERPEGPELPRRRPARRGVMVLAAGALVAAVPAYAVVSSVIGSDRPGRARPEALASTGSADPPVAAAAAAGTSSANPTHRTLTPGVGPAAPGPVVSGDTGEFVRTLPLLPTAAPTVPAPRPRAATDMTIGTAGSTAGSMSSAPTGTAGGNASASETTVAGSRSKPLSAHQQREARRQAKWEAKQERLAQRLAKDAGK